MFTSILTTVEGTFSIQSVMISMTAAIILGIIIAATYMLQGKYTKQFVTTLIILPVLVQSVIMIVNGNLGTSVAVLGAFGLVRFRSLPGSSREISSIFFAMAVGLATGMGFITYAIVVTIIVSAAMLLMSKLKMMDANECRKELRITIPENLDYSEIFDDLMDEYTTDSKLIRVKTTNMGSMYELSYDIEMKTEKKEKDFIDAIRCRNGNLTIICSRSVIGRDEL